MVLLLNICLTLSFSAIDATDQEWISEGYSTHHRIVYPFDHIQPLSGSRESIAMQVFYSSNEYGYRMILVGRDKLVVVDEDDSIQPLEITFAPDSCDQVVFSPNGRHLVTYRSSTDGTNASFIDVEDRTITRFHVTNSSNERMPWLYISEDGAVVSISGSVFRIYDIAGNSFEERSLTGDSTASFGFDSRDWEILRYSDYEDSMSTLEGFSVFGDTLWSYQVPYSNCGRLPVLGKLLNLVFTIDVITCVSSIDGRIKWSLDYSALSEEREMIRRVRISANGEFWCAHLGKINCSIDESRRSYFIIGVADATDEPQLSLTRPDFSNWWIRRFWAVADNGFVLFELWASNTSESQFDLKYMLVDSEGIPIWASQALDMNGLGLSDFTPAWHAEPMYAALSPDGYRITYVDCSELSVHSVTITQGE